MATHRRAVLLSGIWSRKRLQDPSLALTQINRDFLKPAENLKLISFWESDGLPGAGIIVPQYSATLGIPGEMTLLSGYHLNIANSSSEKDINFQRVATRLAILIEDITAGWQTQLEIKFTGMERWQSSFIKRAKHRLGGIRHETMDSGLDWVINTPEFRTWNARILPSLSYERVLWIQGPPGVGKSTIAAFIIEKLTGMHPDALVLYYFSEKTETAFDIIRTLADEVLEQDPIALTRFKTLQNVGDEIHEGLGVDATFRSLLEKQLDQTSRDVYIILDGLDEMDVGRMDKMDPNKPELDVLMKCLLFYTSARLLLFGRPNSLMRLESVLNPTVITINTTDTMQAIKSFVKEKITKSERLRHSFENAKIDPEEYFLNNSGGMFRWVRLVLEDLSRTYTDNEFETSLQTSRSFSLEAAYDKILERVLKGENKESALEILRWLVVAKRDLDIDELRIVVIESGVAVWKKSPFSHFLHAECGSFLTFVPDSSGRTIVSLVHDSFREFLITHNPLLNDIDANTHVAALCLHRLSRASANTGSDVLLPYAASFWVDHLEHAHTSKLESWALLVDLHNLITSTNIETWIKYGLKKVTRNPREGLDFGRYLRNIGQWLETSSRFLTNLETPKEFEGTALTAALAWSVETINKGVQRVIGEHVGKAAANVWLYETIAELEEVKVSFLLALKYYRQENGRPDLAIDGIQKLTDDDISAIKKWAGSENGRRVNMKNLGAAFFFLDQWDKCIECFTESRMRGHDFWATLGEAYVATGDSEEAIDALKRAIALDALSLSSWDHLEGMTVFHWAAVRGHRDVIELLLRKDADINSRDQTGSTVLQRAVDGGHTDVIKLLLSVGADINSRDQTGSTILQRAVDGGHKDVIKLLLSNGADINLRDQSGKTALQIAVNVGHKDVVELLLSKGGDIEARDDGGRTALHRASEGGNKDLVELLLAKGADVGARDGSGSTALDLAAEWHHKDVVQLLKRATNVGAVDQYGYTAVELAAREGNKNFIDENGLRFRRTTMNLVDSQFAYDTVRGFEERGRKYAKAIRVEFVDLRRTQWQQEGSDSKNGKIKWNNRAIGNIIVKQEYSGDTKGCLPHGWGCWSREGSDHLKYVGDWENGVPSGRGCFFRNGVRVYEGQVFNGRPNGNGIYFWPDATQYQGHIEDGKFSGPGKMTSANIVYQDNLWSDGRHSGQGSFYLQGMSPSGMVLGTGEEEDHGLRDS